MGRVFLRGYALYVMFRSLLCAILNAFSLEMALVVTLIVVEPLSSLYFYLMSAGPLKGKILNLALFL